MGLDRPPTHHKGLEEGPLVKYVVHISLVLYVPKKLSGKRLSPGSYVRCKDIFELVR